MCFPPTNSMVNARIIAQSFNLLDFVFFFTRFIGNKYIQEVFENVYKVVMKLTIVDVDIDDFGAYKCVAKNSLGETDGTIKIYRKYFNSIMHIFFRLSCKLLCRYNFVE